MVQRTDYLQRPGQSRFTILEVSLSPPSNGDKNYLLYIW